MFFSPQFCEVITLSWLKHLSGKVVRIMLDYVDHVNICWKLEAVLKEQELWADIKSILSKYLIFRCEMAHKLFWDWDLWCWRYFYLFLTLVGPKVMF